MVTRVRKLADAYNDTSIIFRLLRHLGWGDLVNLGYYTLPSLPAVCGGLAFFQRSLARRSLALLDAVPGDVVLDAACGRGHTTAALADTSCHALGIDLQPQQIELARARFGHRPRTSFAVADMTRLPAQAAGVRLTPGSVDRVHCLEAAFHLGPAGRRAFLDESYRVLRPGGRLVLVDLTWPDTAPRTLAESDPHRLVRDTWQFEDFNSPERYVAHASAAGFDVRAMLDWTHPVVRRSTGLLGLCSLLVSSPTGRHMLRLRWPGLKDLTPQDWQDLATVLRAHQALGQVAGYHALVCNKPGPSATHRP
ncbi:class I SAM-dependent methyltransferase [Streptomyces zagrosensis]|uniref:SAM-dependent methyltransferase n=1 Tax=Streptomyces zagrosensis TaxID=1042984 RepID=A0A7W9QEW1_9ACTN|nr:class I SAM-dependent methyltransferase [Streptomyces zagrosensis]MBB5938428.1 SAM-dependent methyltransferase [Streptomyces zagrosensis]